MSQNKPAEIVYDQPKTPSLSPPKVGPCPAYQPVTFGASGNT